MCRITLFKRSCAFNQLDRGLTFGLRLYQSPNFVCASSESSSVTAHM